MDIHSIPQIQTQFQISDHQIKSREACLAQFEKLQGEIQDLHDMFNQLHGEVHSQKEGVNVIAENVEVTQVQVEQGEQSLRQAVRYKKAMYPVCGGLIGMCVGGILRLNLKYFLLVHSLKKNTVSNYMWRQSVNGFSDFLVGFRPLKYMLPTTYDCIRSCSMASEL